MIIKTIPSKIFLLTLLLSSSASIGFGQIKYQVYAEYLYFFANNTEFPNNKDSGDFIIGVIGTENLYTAIRTISSTKKVGQRTIIVKQFSDVKHLDNCHILFVDSNREDELNLAFLFSKRSNVLLVSECIDGLRRPSTFTFVRDDEGIKFEFNEDAARKQHLRISDDLYRLAKLGK